jgi:hypothetical protein
LEVVDAPRDATDAITFTRQSKGVCMFHTIVMLTTLAAASTGGVETPTETITVNGPAGVEDVVIGAFPTARTFVRGKVTSATTTTMPTALGADYYTEYQILTEAGTAVHAVTHGGITTPAQTDFPVGHVITSHLGTHPDVGDEILAVAYRSADGIAGQFSYPWAGQRRSWFGVHGMLSLRAQTSTAAATGFFATAACVGVPSPALLSAPDIEAFESALVSAGFVLIQSVASTPTYDPDSQQLQFA